MRGCITLTNLQEVRFCMPVGSCRFKTIKGIFLSVGSYSCPLSCSCSLNCQLITKELQGFVSICMKLCRYLLRPQLSEPKQYCTGKGTLKILGVWIIEGSGAQSSENRGRTGVIALARQN